MHLPANGQLHITCFLEKNGAAHFEFGRANSVKQHQNICKSLLICSRFVSIFKPMDNWFEHRSENSNPKSIRRGRAATSNETNRFEKEKRTDFDDGWEFLEERANLKTEYIVDRSKTILSKNSSPDVPFDRSINPYRGCEHGCIYCFARPTHAYLGYSPGLDFESRILFKPNAVALLNEALARPGYKVKPIAFGTNTDPYQPAEKTLKITRQIISYLLEHRHPLTIVTKGSLILRDIDLLKALAKERLVHVAISVTTLDNNLHRKMEPRAASPGKRIAMIAALKEAGVPVSVLAAPMIPKINDHELESILKAAKNAGALSARYLFVRLPLEVAPLFREWLEENYPDRAQKVMRHIQSARNGQDYQSEFHERMRGTGAYAELLNARFKVAAGKLELLEDKTALKCDLFRKPSKDIRQLSLF